METKYYQIGELASLLNISRQMIRYYEECGVISPKRDETNNYRLYSTMDYFALEEAIALSRFDINIKDIYGLKMSDYFRQLKDHMDRFTEKTGKQIAYEELMIRRAKQMTDKAGSADLNVGNVWIRLVPAHAVYPLMRSKDDTYGEVVTPKEILPAISKSSVMVFGDAVIEFQEEEELWSVSFEEEYYRTLSLPQTEAARLIPEEYCLCTVMDMGEIGSFQAETVRAFRNHAAGGRYPLSDRLYGVLLARGESEGRFHRYLEVRIPLETLQ